MSQILVVLKPFLEATETLSAGDALLSQVIPLERELEKQMEKFQGINVPGWGRPVSPDVQALVRQLKEVIRRWLDPLWSSAVHMMAGICDLKVKGSMCTGSTKTLDHWTQVLVNKVRETKVQSQSPPCQPLPMWAMDKVSMLGSKRTRPQLRTGSVEASVATYLTEEVDQMWQDLLLALTLPPGLVLYPHQLSQLIYLSDNPEVIVLFLSLCGCILMTHNSLAT
uniref:Uncharacterized protein n=1 Tax=Crocodylus porosus TaxID=8502 RepID=A0A7M4F5A3_CROPO